MSITAFIEEVSDHIARTFEGPSAWWDDQQARMALTAKRRIDTYKMIAAMLRSDLPLSDCLLKLIDTYKNPRDPFRHVLKAWFGAMEAGKTFPEALTGWVPDTELVLISAGERSHRLSEALDQAARGITVISEIKGTFIKALLYPLGIILFSVTLLGFYADQMVPILTQIFKLEDFPKHIQLLFSLGGFVAGNYLILALAFGSLVGLISWSLNGWVGPMRNRFDAIAPWSIYRTYNSASFLLSLSALLQAGISLGEALQEIRSLSGRWMKGHIDGCAHRLAKGASYKDVFETNMLDEETRALIAIYAELTEFEKAINDIGNQSIDESIERVTRKAATAKTAAMFIAASLIGWIVLSTLSVQQVAQQMTKSAQNSR